MLKEAEDQAVLGLVVDAAPKAVQDKWRSHAGVVTANFVRILHYQKQLCELFKANDIPLVILKGTAAVVYYPNPAQRSMGDIDYLVSPEHFDQATELLVTNGYKIKDDPRAPRHMHVHKDNISFEQHRFFSSEGIDVERFILEGMHHIEITEIYGTSFPMLPKLANGLVLLGHMVQHLKSGLGLRQVIDWMMYVDRVLHDGFWEAEFQAAAREVRLEKLAIVVTRMCQKYLGLTTDDITWCADADEQLCDDLIENLLVSGNFGRRNGDGNRVEFVTASIKRDGLFQRLQRSGEANWKAYKKHKWLKPFCWIYQSGRYVNRGIKARRSGKQLRDDIDRANKRNKLLRDLEIV